MINAETVNRLCNEVRLFEDNRFYCDFFWGKCRGENPSPERLSFYIICKQTKTIYWSKCSESGYFHIYSLSLFSLHSPQFTRKLATAIKVAHPCRYPMSSAPYRKAPQSSAEFLVLELDPCIAHPLHLSCQCRHLQNCH